MRQKKIVFNLVVIGFSFSTGAFSQQSVQWDVRSPQTIIAGSGCQKDVDAFASTNGNDVAIVFTRLGVDLPGGGSQSLAERKNCSLRIPATIAPGIYIGQLVQRLSYGVIKTANATGALSTRSTFFGFDVSPYTVTLPYGYSLNRPLMTQQRVDRFDVRTTPHWFQGWCARNRAPRGFYQANIAVSGQKSHRYEDLIMFVDGLDLKYEVGASLVRCQI